jgi:hypothetical protein
MTSLFSLSAPTSALAYTLVEYGTPQLNAIRKSQLDAFQYA